MMPHISGIYFPVNRGGEEETGNKKNEKQKISQHKSCKEENQRG